MNESNDPSDFRNAMRKGAIAIEHEKEIAAIGSKHLEAIETTALFPLWQSLGDGTPNYWQAYQVITAVTQIQAEAATKISPLAGNHLRAEAYNALSKIFAQQALCLTEMQARCEETERQFKALK